ncbi:uncharacterized protein LOC126084692 isoform X1 [Elephas maximus indicus]|uniref:uncharacterized protein LOC126084692 isoform X1 n=1 Tax=Elephas maximus indicus TaxID=99487 RepID=UPI0021166E28|nr:uncharacterized protein LOC126084692 isoform X1 [Elephas maximus indicus]
MQPERVAGGWSAGEGSWSRDPGGAFGPYPRQRGGWAQYWGPRSMLRGGTGATPPFTSMPTWPRLPGWRSFWRELRLPQPQLAAAPGVWWEILTPWEWRWWGGRLLGAPPSGGSSGNYVGSRRWWAARPSQSLGRGLTADLRCHGNPGGYSYCLSLRRLAASAGAVGAWLPGLLRWHQLQEHPPHTPSPPGCEPGASSGVRSPERPPLPFKMEGPQECAPLSLGVSPASPPLPTRLLGLPSTSRLQPECPSNCFTPPPAQSPREPSLETPEAPGDLPGQPHPQPAPLSWAAHRVLRPPSLS